MCSNVVRNPFAVHLHNLSRHFLECKTSLLNSSELSSGFFLHVSSFPVCNISCLRSSLLVSCPPHWCMLSVEVLCLQTSSKLAIEFLKCKHISFFFLFKNRNLIIVQLLWCFHSEVFSVDSIQNEFSHFTKYFDQNDCDMFHLPFIQLWIHM